MKVYSFFFSFQRLCKCSNTPAALCHQKTRCSPTTRIDCGVIFLSAWQHVAGMKVSTQRISADQNTVALFALEFFRVFFLALPPDSTQSSQRRVCRMFPSVSLIATRGFYLCWRIFFYFFVIFLRMDFSSMPSHSGADGWKRTHISCLCSRLGFLLRNGFTSVPSSPSIRPRTESIVFSKWENRSS